MMGAEGRPKRVVTEQGDSRRPFRPETEKVVVYGGSDGFGTERLWPLSSLERWPLVRC